MSVQQIIEYLQQMNRIHSQMLELGHQKKRVLVRNDVQELSRLTQQESKLARQSQEAEQAWLQAAADFFAQKGLQPEPNMTVTDLVKLIFNADERQAVLKERDQLLTTINELKEVNALNQELIEHSLAFINYTLDILTDAPEEFTYSNPDKKTKGTARRGVFDAKI